MLLKEHVHFLTAIWKSRNGESRNGMRGMMRMRGIRVGMRGIRVGMQGNRGGNAGNGVGMWGIRVGMRGIGVGNAGNQGGNAGNRGWENMFSVNMLLVGIKENNAVNVCTLFILKLFTDVIISFS